MSGNNSNNHQSESRPSPSDGSSPHIKSPVTWQDFGQILDRHDRDLARRQSESDSSPPSNNSSLPIIDSDRRKYFPDGKVLGEIAPYSKCKYCLRPILLAAMASHEDNCPARIRKELNNGGASTTVTSNTADTSNDASSNGSSTPLSSQAASNESAIKAEKESATTGSTKSRNNNKADADAEPPTKVKKTKKRKADGEMKKKEPKKKKMAAPKQQNKQNINMKVDVERQCGVPLPNGGFCARSLTCKTHSMGAKRAVLGRSQPYDILLAAYQKRNQMKQATLNMAAHNQEDQDVNAGPIDPEEEVASVMSGVERSMPIPLETKVIMPVQLKTRFFRMREMLANAFLPRMAGPAGLGGIIGRSVLIDPDNPSDYHYVRSMNARIQMLKQQQQQAAMLQIQQQQQQQRAGTQINSVGGGGGGGGQQQIKHE